MKDKKNSPKCPTLRFPEFQGEWEEVIIKDYGTVVTGNTPSKKEPENYDNGCVPWVSPADLGKKKYIYDTKSKLSKVGFSKARAVPKGTILVTCIGSTIGKIGVAASEMATNQQINSVIVDSHHSNNFVYYSIQKRFPRYIDSIAVQAVPILSKSTFEGLQNYSTTKEEQDKIGHFLELIDQRIDTQIKIIEELERLKNHMVLSAITGSKAPIYRFPNFNLKWKTQILGDILKVYMCKRVFLHETQESGDIPFYKIGTFGKQADSYIPRELYIHYKSKYNFPDKGEILISCSGTVGRCIKYDGEPAYFQDSNIVWIANDQKYILNDFLFYILNNKNWKKLNSTTITRIYKDDLEKIVLKFPELDEQTKVVHVLSAFDRKLANAKHVLQNYKKQKYFLLQNLFI